jgi:hypothetical protein
MTDCPSCGTETTTTDDGIRYCPGCCSLEPNTGPPSFDPTDDDRPRVDEEFLHARLDELEELLGDPLLPIGTRLAARDAIRAMRAELDPTIATEAEDR